MALISPVSTSVETSASAAPVTGWAADRVLGDGLQARVERGVDLQPALARRRDAVLVDQLLLDEVEEVLLRALLVAEAAVQPEPLAWPPSCRSPG